MSRGNIRRREIDRLCLRVGSLDLSHSEYGKRDDQGRCGTGAVETLVTADIEGVPGRTGQTRCAC